MKNVTVTFSQDEAAALLGIIGFLLEKFNKAGNAGRKTTPKLLLSAGKKLSAEMKMQWLFEAHVGGFENGQETQENL